MMLLAVSIGFLVVSWAGVFLLTRPPIRCSLGFHKLTWASEWFATCERCERHFRVQG